MRRILCVAAFALLLLNSSKKAIASDDTRHPVGVVVIYGATVSMILTLFAVRVVYTLLAGKAHSPQFVSRMIDRMTGQSSTPAPSSRPVL